VTVRLGLARGEPDPLTDSLLEAIALAAESIDVRTVWIRSGADQTDCDAVLVVGAPRSHAWFFEAPPSMPRISWFGEPLPRVSASASTFAQRPSATRSGRANGTALRAARVVARPLRRLSPPGRMGAFRESAAIEYERFDNMRMAVWCSERGARIVVTSRDRGASLAAVGLAAAVVPFGYHPRHAGPLTSPSSARDIAIAIIGSGLSSDRLRRGRILGRLRPQLQSLGTVVEVDGRWGSDRDAILRRARVVLDVQRVPGNFTGLRWLLASAAGSVYVVEPMDDPAPLRPGIDHIEAPVDHLIEEVRQLLGDEPARRSIAEESQVLLRGDLAMGRSLERVLAG
jgi:hypothetical protein